MAEKITKQIIEQIILEELNELDEDLWDRIKAQAAGALGGAQQVGRNIGAAALGTGPGAQAGAARKIKMALSKTKSAIPKLQTFHDDFIGDMQSFFGDNMEQAPQAIKPYLQHITQGTTNLVNNVRAVNIALGKGGQLAGVPQAPAGAPADSPQLPKISPPTAGTPQSQPSTAGPNPNKAFTGQPATEPKIPQHGAPPPPPKQKPTQADKTEKEKGKKLTPDEAAERNKAGVIAHREKSEKTKQDRLDRINMSRRASFQKPWTMQQAMDKRMVQESLIKKIRAIVQENQKFKVVPTHKDLALMQKLRAILEENKTIRIINNNGRKK